MNKKEFYKMEEEFKRIPMNMEIQLDRLEFGWQYNFRKFIHQDENIPGLAMSRSFGDFVAA